MFDGSLDMSHLALGLVWFVVFLFSTTLHEAAHAWSALKLGDPTAYEGGQVTLNPWPHVRREPVGMVVVPIISFLLAGWVLGWASAPYDPRWADRHPRRAAWMALAGPLANLALALLAGGTIALGVAGGWLAPPDRIDFSHLTAAAGSTPELVAVALSVTFVLNLVLLVFNLFPVPPLDGAGAIQLLLPDAWAERWRALLASHPAFAFLGILVAWRLFWPVFQPVLDLALRLLYPGVTYG